MITNFSFTLWFPQAFEKEIFFSKNILRYELYIIFETFEYEGFLHIVKGTGHVMPSTLPNFPDIPNNLFCKRKSHLNFKILFSLSIFLLRNSVKPGVLYALNFYFSSPPND